jgi:hypothetical protein
VDEDGGIVGWALRCRFYKGGGGYEDRGVVVDKVEGVKKMREESQPLKKRRMTAAAMVDLLVGDGVSSVYLF